MKKGLAITLIGCVVLFILGLILFFVGLNAGGSIGFNVDFKNHEVSTAKDYKLNTGEQEVSAFSNIDINASAADITIVEGDSYKVKYALYEKSEPTIGVENDTLKIVTKNEKIPVFTFFGTNTENSPKIEITVPAGTKFSDVSIVTNSGDIKLDGYTIDTLNLTSNAGDFDFKNLTTTSIKMNVDAGDIDLKDITTEDFQLESNAGDIKATGLTVDTAKIDMDAGDVNILDSEIKNVKAELSAGDMKLKNIKADNFDIDADYGDIDLEIAGEEADYNIDIDVSAGDVEINDKDVKSHYSSKSNTDKTLKINTDAGDVEVSFR